MIPRKSSDQVPATSHAQVETTHHFSVYDRDLKRGVLTAIVNAVIGVVILLFVIGLIRRAA
jgi:uncharacterized membrane protein YeaQ/YmgE (transglycosylase-associated protein family)